MILMSETQWPRYEVFLQEKAGAPHVDVGSVHAIDPELALQNARDVFVRRPGCTSLWVCPVTQIYSRTRQELENWVPEQAASKTPLETYFIFCKYKSAGTAELIGEVNAGGAEAALALALQQYTANPVPFVWWVVPVQAMTCSEPEDIDPMFTPAAGKPFRQSSYYHVITAMREARKETPDEG
jgi:ring-1,2-phenylacetyl-CoA epoxidase subunit PaaB